MIAAADPRPSPNALRVEAARGRRQLSVGVGCLTLLGLTLGAVGHVAVHVKRMDVGLQLGNERRAETELVEQRKKLEIEIQMLKSPARIETMAREKLKMGPPEFQNLRVVSAPAAAEPEAAAAP